MVKCPSNTIICSFTNKALETQLRSLWFPAKKETINHDEGQEDRSAGQELAEDGSVVDLLEGGSGS